MSSVCRANSARIRAPLTSKKVSPRFRQRLISAEKECVKGMRLRATRVWFRIRSEERGYSLPELLVVCAMFALVLVGVLDVFGFAQAQAPKDIEYSHAISEATAGLARMTRELRNAYRIDGTDGDPTTGVGSTVTFFAYLNDVDTEVEYSCDQPSLSNPTNHSYYSCRRVSAPDGSALPSISTGAVIVDRVENPPGLTRPDVFTFIGATGTPNPIYPSYVQENVLIPAAGPLTHSLTHTITLNNGTALPNLQGGE
jgi:type II secretory pathway pseudopilin PulG